MLIEYWSYSTQRLLIREWRSSTTDEWNHQDLAIVVKSMLTKRVTRSLPPDWQGPYTLDRAQNWIGERDNEGITLLVVVKSSKTPVGLVILFEAAKGGYGSELRLGYILTEWAWGQGFASELIDGFVQWCHNNEVASITGGVERDNIASRRVLEKCGFVCDPSTKEAAEQLFVLNLRHNPKTPEYD